MERRKFTGEFKREAVKLATQVGVSKAKVAKGRFRRFAATQLEWSTDRRLGFI